MRGAAAGWDASAEAPFRLRVGFASAPRAAAPRLTRLAAMKTLAAETGPDWLERVLGDLDLLLLDHAHCEKKAAGTALRLVFRYPQQRGLAAPLSRLAREELVHFEQVVERIEARGRNFGPLRAAPYAARLRAEVRTAEPERLLDTLLVCALIEARSCERFRLLAAAAPEPALGEFYAGLLASEARHRGAYVALAERVAPAAEVSARYAQLAEREAAVLAEGPAWVRMHSA